MFTGIVENLGKIVRIEASASNRTFIMESLLSSALQVDQSIAHNGVCLTVESIVGNTFQVTAIAETLNKTSLQQWKEGDFINLERAMVLNARVDGHLVQGHVDATMTCIDKKDEAGSYQYTFAFDPKFAGLLVEKGSICINGISLTVFNVGAQHCSVAIIPYTYNHTNIQYLKVGDIVNVEFDILGKYVARQLKYPINNSSDSK
jgi:riboflavin synthase